MLQVKGRGEWWRRLDYVFAPVLDKSIIQSKA